MNFQRCDDGSDGRRGFVSTPANDTDWPVCKYGKYNQNLYSQPTHTILSHSLPATVCPVPPPSPPGGQRQVIKTTFSRIWRFSSEGFIHCGAGGAQEELFVGQRGEHVEVFLVPGWQAHNWMMEWSSSMISLSFCWALTYFRRASLWRLRVTGRRSWAENSATGRRTRLKSTPTAFTMPRMRWGIPTLSL